MPPKKRAKQKSSHSPEPLPQPKKATQRKGTKAIFWVIVILVVILVLLIPILLYQSGVIGNPFQNVGQEEQRFTIRDECTMILGNLIHTVNDEGVCEQKCKSECGVREMMFVRSVFTQSFVDCHRCDCYCK